MHKKFFAICAMLFLFSAFFSFSAKTIRALPSNFQQELLLASGLSAPTALEFAPDGRLFILEQAGNIRIYKNGKLLDGFFDQVPAIASSDRGALGLTFDTNWPTDPYLYIYYIDINDGFHKIVRFNASQDTATGDMLEIYNSHRVAGTNHAGGALAFGTDGKLYLSIGDSGLTFTVQDLNTPLGKVLRMNKDGSIPIDNPFSGQAGKEQRVWAWGLRNPFRFQIDKLTGRMFLGDVGESKWEEINVIEKGKNYGWPLKEGLCTSNCIGFTDPVHAYPHTGSGASVSGGFVYRGSQFPAEYQGKYFFADFVKSFIEFLDWHEHDDGVVEQHGVLPFATGVGTITDLKQGPDGALYFVNIFPSRLFRIIYNSTGNLAPSANAGADKLAGPEPLTVNFSSTGSIDPEGGVLTYNWNFGDGTSSTDANPQKIYTNPGAYTVQLTVSDVEHSVLAFPLDLQVGTPPTLNILSPLDGSLYKAGDIINYNSSGTDSTGALLPDSAFTTEIRFHHNVHYHPSLRPTQSKSGQFYIPTTGEKADDVFYEVLVTAKNALGLKTTKSVNVLPKKSIITLNTLPAGLVIKLDGQPNTTPFSLNSVEGIERTIEASTQVSGNTSYGFSRWLDGGPSNRIINTPEADTEYTAVFSELAPFNAEYFTNINLSGEPALKRLDNPINFDWGGGSPNPVIPIDNFSARWTKNQFLGFGRYKFTISSDDGNRLYIDGNKVIDDWVHHGEKATSVILDLEEGEHEIKMEYFELGGGAIARLFWEMTPDQPQPTESQESTNYTIKFWSFDGTPNFPETAPTLERTETAIDFNWGEGSPGEGIGINNFLIQAAAKKEFREGWYKFSALSDDGVRVLLDDEVILDYWNDHPATSFSVEKIISAGIHDVVVEYYERGGKAQLKFDYQKIDVRSVSFSGKCYNGIALEGEPVLEQEFASLSFNWGMGSPAAEVPVNNFSCVFEKSQVYSEGPRNFTLTGDDGVRLYIDGVMVTDKWKDQQAATYLHIQNLTGGEHTIKVEYYEKGGQAVVSLAES